jgi:LytS/YehU family sensor histidine kinase
LEIENPEIAKLFPPGSQLFSADRPSGSIKVYSNQKNIPTYLSHWAIQDTDTAGHPLKVTGILQNFTVVEERDAARLEARFLELEMQSLRAHLNPHLLFNCLTGLRGLISEDPAKAREFSGNLARFLRAAVDSQNQKTISLRQEILICEDFARLEELRGRPTTLKVQLEHEDGEIQIPPLTLVTLLENAAKHGNRNGEKFMPVEITSARPDARHLHLQVRQPGTLTPINDPHNHAGLNLIRRQIDMVLGDQARLDLVEEPGGTVVARLVVPI